MTLTASRPRSSSYLAPREGETGQVSGEGGGRGGGSAKIKAPFPDTDAFVAHVKAVTPPNSVPPWIPLAPQNLPPSLRPPHSARMPPRSSSSSTSSSSSRSYTLAETGSKTTRELLLGRNTPSTRPGSRASRSRSSPRLFLQRLSLESYPMEHSQRDLTLRCQLMHRQQLLAAEGLKKTMAWSEGLRQYSRSRFDHAVQTLSGLGGGDQPPSYPPSSALTSRGYCRTLSTPLVPGTSTAGTEPRGGGADTGAASPAPRETPAPPKRPTVSPGDRRSLFRPRTPQAAAPPPVTNGPTLGGSVLYNPKPMLLNAIRIRPKSEPPESYRHLHECPCPIKRQMEAINQQYRVVELGSSTQTGVGALLVPIQPPAGTSPEQEDGAEGAPESEMSLHLGSQGEGEEAEDEEGGTRAPPTVGVTPETPRGATTSPKPLHYSQSAPESTGRRSADSLQPGHKQSQVSRPNSSESAVSRKSTALRKRRSKDPKVCHWVDLYSVSSVEKTPAPGEHPEHEAPAETPQGNVGVPEGVPGVSDPQAAPDQPTSPSPPPEPEEEGPKLPTYLCPSSEQKSREAATLRWLRSTAFRNGIHTVPLV